MFKIEQGRRVVSSDIQDLVLSVKQRKNRVIQTTVHGMIRSVNPGFFQVTILIQPDKPVPFRAHPKRIVGGLTKCTDNSSFQGRDFRT